MEAEGVSPTTRVGSSYSLPRKGNVSSHAILPTWVPFRTTVFSEEKLFFSLYLMEGKQRGLAGGAGRDSSATESRSRLAVPFRELEL